MKPFKIQEIGTRSDYTTLDVLNLYSIVFEKYENFIKETDNIDFIDFLKLSSETSDVADFIEENVEFEVENFIGFYQEGVEYNAIIHFKEKDDEGIDTIHSYSLFGSYMLNSRYVIHLVHSYIFIEDYVMKTKYFYYAD